MGIFSRFSDIVNSNINAILDKAEDPEKLVRLMIQEMEDTLVEVRSAAARSIADKKELARKLKLLTKEGLAWQDKAELAISKGRDDLAKAALAERAKVNTSVEALDQQTSAVTEGLAKLNTDIARLEEKLADAKARQKAIIARHQTASHRLQVRTKIHNPKVDDAFVRFESFERRMEDLEGRVEAYDLGSRKDLHNEFVTLESEEVVEKELADLKAKMAATRSNASD
jgi:phage shock protein A